MRGLVIAVLTILISTPAWCGNAMSHNRMVLPPASPAYENSDGDPYGVIARKFGHQQSPSDLERFAQRFGAGRNGSHTDLFYRPLGSDQTAESGGLGIAGTFSNGAAQLQLRWDTSR
jgi:hypothetical protein